MNTIRISTTQNIDIDYDVAGLGERIAAYLIDIGIFLCVYFFFILIALGFASVSSSFGFILVIIVYVLLFAFYDLICEIFFNGQTIGKKTMKIRVISLDGTQPTIGQYLLRWLFRLVDFSLTSGVCALICIATSKNSQRVGDIVANTTVIKTNPRVQLEAIAFRPVATEGYIPIFPQVADLGDNDIVLIHEVLENYKKSHNRILTSNMARKVRTHLGIQDNNMDDLDFLSTIIKDYNHISAQDQ